MQQQEKKKCARNKARCKQKKKLCIYVCMSSSLSFNTKQRLKMRNSFFINHAFRMLFHVLNIFNYFHIEHYIMCRIFNRRQSEQAYSPHMSTQNGTRFLCVLFFHSFLLNHSVALWNCFSVISPIQIETDIVVMVIVYQHCCSRLSALQPLHEEKKKCCSLLLLV